MLYVWIIPDERDETTPIRREQWTTERSILVAHATGVVAAQARCAMNIALLLMDKRANADGCSLGDIAEAVLGGAVVFDRRSLERHRRALELAERGSNLDAALGAALDAAAAPQSLDLDLTNREALLSQTFVEMADALVAEFDVVDVLTILTRRCVDLFDIDQAGLMLATDGVLRVAASSSQVMRYLELFEVQVDEGPCIDCYRSGELVECEDLSAEVARWPAFAPRALGAGIRSVFAVPMRLRDETIGSLNLLRNRVGALADADLAAARAVADVATMGILHHRMSTERALLAERLAEALDTRIVIEQAKGVLAATTGISIEAAFASMCSYAEHHDQQLVDIALGLVSRVVVGVQFAESPPD